MRVALAHLVEIAQAVAVVDHRHLVLAVGAFLPGAQHRVADVAGQNLHPPRRRHQRLRQRQVHGQRIAQVVVGQRIGHQHGQRVSFLSGGAARAPDADRVFAPRTLLLEQLFEHGFLKQIQLRLVAEEAGLVDGQVLQQLGQFLLALLADQQPVVGVERIDAALLQAAQQPVLQEVRAPLVEVHAALLVDQRLQQLQFRVRQYGSRCRSGCAHASRSRLTQNS